MGGPAAEKVDLNELKRVGIIAQKQKDLFLIRLRTVGGTMTAEELETVAGVSRRFGGSRVHLTTRQAVEIHNIALGDLQAAREDLERSGLVLGVCGPRGRGIVACPGSATCTSGLIETKELAAELDAAYLREPAPHKFKIGISGCPNNCSKPVENDIGIMGGVLPKWDGEACIACNLCVTICPNKAISRQGRTFLLNRDACMLCGLCIRNCSSSAWKAEQVGYTLYLGGTMGTRPRIGTLARTLIGSKEELLQYVRQAFEYYREQGRKKERFGHMLDRIGTGKAFGEIFAPREKNAPQASAAEAAPVARKHLLDLRGVCCPMNFVKAKLAMEKLGSGETIDIYLDDGEPIVNVSRSLKDEGHQVLLVTPKENYFELLVEKR